MIKYSSDVTKYARRSKLRDVKSIMQINTVTSATVDSDHNEVNQEHSNSKQRSNQAQVAELTFNKSNAKPNEEAKENVNNEQIIETPN